MTLLYRAKQLVFAGVTEGVFAKAVFAAAALAEEQLGADAVTYMPRLVEAPGLRVSALWLFSRRRSSFIVIRAPHVPPKAALELAPDIRSCLATATAHFETVRRA